MYLYKLHFDSANTKKPLRSIMIKSRIENTIDLIRGSSVSEAQKIRNRQGRVEYRANTGHIPLLWVSGQDPQ
ncbi:uncharacterized protein Bfra_006965 [Botrytis fragariae]|uniref:Uncharacterized protein n=1 Tax=Botrytis fragariae TaxID=1964551 RepID=A0A8H6ECV8_9HELO|nr:uncharacterized protein Bfra_006965 [Botrytis fragariae]KAF5867767.1 hypothetical protein Bfra_006965 [Botrytis fragariae]